MEKPTAVVILSAWGSGSTAVTGFLDCCGGYSCPPHVETIDERTPNCYEPRAYQEALWACVDEYTLRFKGDAEIFIDFLSTWLPEQAAMARAAGKGPLVLKHPLQSLLLPVIDAIADCRYVVVRRPLEEIEATRQRRNWHPVLGQAGAEVIYRVTDGWLTRTGRPSLDLSYRDFLDNPELRSGLLAFAGLAPSPEAREDAEGFLRR